MLGTNIAQSLAGLSQAERVEPKDRRRPTPVRGPGGREEPEVVVQIDTGDGIRQLTSGRDEESRQDHERHPAYRGAVAPGEQHKLDVEA